MPVEYDFMKSKSEKGIPEEEFKNLREEYNQKANKSSASVRKTIFIFLGIFAVMFLTINLVAMLYNDANFGQGIGNYTWLAVEFIFLALFLYDPKVEEDKRYKYETDQNIILKSLQNKIKLNKIRLGAVIFFSVIFFILNIIAWWFLFTYLSNNGNEFEDLKYIIVTYNLLL